MLFVNFVRQTEGELHPLVYVEPDLAITADVVVNCLDVPGQVRSLNSQAVWVLLLMSLYLLDYQSLWTTMLPLLYPVNDC